MSPLTVVSFPHSQKFLFPCFAVSDVEYLTVEIDRVIFIILWWSRSVLVSLAGQT